MSKGQPAIELILKKGNLMSCRNPRLRYFFCVTFARPKKALSSKICDRLNTVKS